MKNPSAGVENGFLLLFQVENENFGIPLEQVLEVILPLQLIRIPGDPEMAEGIIGYRGDAFTVIRIQSPAENQFGSKPKMPPSPDGKYELEEKIILLNPVPVFGGAMRIALRADRVRGVFRREDGKAVAVSEAADGVLNQNAIFEKSLGFKDARGESIAAYLLDLAEFRRKIVSGFGFRVSS
ncbi:MAG: chemotaxis protein CheW [bacterium]|nr:chemotaxis protein CheW [bacterium]